MITLGSLILLGAFLIAGTASGHQAPQLAVGLCMLGLGWSCTMISGSTLLTDSVPIEQLPNVQGTADVDDGLRRRDSRVAGRCRRRDRLVRDPGDGRRLRHPAAALRDPASAAGSDRPEPGLTIQTMSQYDIYRAANQRLEALIDPNPATTSSLRAVQARAAARLKAMAAFLEYLGNPHRAAPVIHVGGTSGKGSTATAIAAILRAAGRSTLLHTSPFLQVSTEKLQIDGQLIDAPLFAELTDEVIDAAERFGQIQLTYGEAWMAIVALAMARLKPDVAVIEVGAGGRFDLTNVVDSSVAVITTIGIDHTETLGPTIPEIAWHKAGIIKHGHPVGAHGVEQPEARAEIDRQAASGRRCLADRIDSAAAADRADRTTVTRPGAIRVDRHSTASRHPGNAPGAERRARRRGRRAFVPGPGDLPLSNEAWPRRASPPASSACRATARSSSTAPTTSRKSARSSRILMRLPRPRVGVIGFLAAKRSDEMIGLLGPALDHVVVARPDVLGNRDAISRTRPNPCARACLGAGRSRRKVLPMRCGWLRGLPGTIGSVIVTGSLYLCGAVRERWYDSREIIEQKTQWPGNASPAILTPILA